jgi:hypothetical protein
MATDQLAREWEEKRDRKKKLKRLWKDIEDRDDERRRKPTRSGYSLSHIGAKSRQESIGFFRLRYLLWCSTNGVYNVKASYMKITQLIPAFRTRYLDRNPSLSRNTPIKKGSESRKG